MRDSQRARIVYEISGFSCGFLWFCVNGSKDFHLDFWKSVQDFSSVVGPSNTCHWKCVGGKPQCYTKLTRYSALTRYRALPPPPPEPLWRVFLSCSYIYIYIGATEKYGSVIHVLCLPLHYVY